MTISNEFKDLLAEYAGMFHHSKNIFHKAFPDEKANDAIECIEVAKNNNNKGVVMLRNLIANERGIK